MPRIPRGQAAGHAYHVLNRGNGGATVFHKDADYAAFLELLSTAKARHPLKIFGFCLMPTHFHLVVAPTAIDALSPLMQWWMTSHVRRYHRYYHSHGHVWQGRFKSFPIQQDAHLLTVLRYVLRNPVRAGLVDHVRDWPWSSLRFPHLTDPLPVETPRQWTHWINQPLFEHELIALRTCVNRQQPFGTAAWQTRIARTLGLESTLRPRGRPRTSPKK
ncbi:MAG: transposase [Nitrospira sp.]|nr:transposase [Nitrospira sp.]